MRNRKISLITASALAIVIAAFVYPGHGLAGDFRELLEEVPEEAEFVIGCANFPEFREQLREIGVENLFFFVAGVFGGEDLKMMYEGFSGRIIITGEPSEEDGLMIMDMAPDSRILPHLEQEDSLGEFSLRRREDGLTRIDIPVDQSPRTIRLGDHDIRVGPHQPPRDRYVLAGYDGETLRVARQRSRVVAPVEKPERNVTDLEAFAGLLDLFDTDNGVLLLIPDIGKIDLTPEQQPTLFGPAPVALEMMQLGKKALLEMIGATRWRASATRLDFLGGINIHSMNIFDDLLQPTGEHVMLARPAWEEAPLTTITARADLLKEVIPAVRRGMAVFHQDIADEFDEELAEINEELGFDIESDFIGNATGQWSIARWSDDRWEFRIQVDDPGLFLEHAEALANFGGEIWRPDVNAPDGMHVIHTRIYAFPLVLTVEGSDAVLSYGDPPALTGQERPDAPGFFADGEKEMIRFGYGISGNDRLMDRIEEKAPPQVKAALDMLPDNTKADISISHGENYTRTVLRTEGITPAWLRSICALILRHIMDME